MICRICGCSLILLNRNVGDFDSSAQWQRILTNFDGLSSPTYGMIIRLLGLSDVALEVLTAEVGWISPLMSAEAFLADFVEVLGFSLGINETALAA